MRALSTGYDRSFLTTDVALPAPTDDRAVKRLDYTHFSVQLDPARRLSAATAVNIDGNQLLNLPRVRRWRLDPRVPASEQAGEELYARNDLDRGHLVRRRDPVWGSPEVAAVANQDTFVFTNAAPQAAAFNQSKDLWNGLENYILEYAEAYKNRISVFTGPVLDPADPVYRGVRIPQQFWKIAAWDTVADGRMALASTGYVLDQSPQLDDIDLTLLPSGPPPLGAYRTFQVPVRDIRMLTALDLEVLVEADRLQPVASALPRSAWVQLGSMHDVVL